MKMKSLTLLVCSIITYSLLIQASASTPADPCVYEQPYIKSAPPTDHVHHVAEYIKQILHDSISGSPYAKQKGKSLSCSDRAGILPLKSTGSVDATVQTRRYHKKISTTEQDTDNPSRIATTPADTSVTDTTTMSGHSKTIYDYDVRAGLEMDQNCAPVKIVLTDKSSASGGLYPIAWEWDMGDQTRRSGEIVEYTYEIPGTFMLTETVTFSDGQIIAGPPATLVVMECESQESSGVEDTRKNQVQEPALHEQSGSPEELPIPSDLAPDEEENIMVDGILYSVVPVTGTDGKKNWRLYDPKGSFLCEPDATGNFGCTFDPDTEDKIRDLGDFALGMKTTDPADMEKRILEMEERMKSATELVMTYISKQDNPALSRLVSHVISPPKERDIVAGWPCPAGYTPGQREAQLKEDYMKNYLIVMEAALEGSVDPGTLDTVAGQTQQNTWIVTMIKLLQNGQASLTKNLDLVTAHQEGVPWSYEEMRVYKDNEAASVTLDSDIDTLTAFASPDPDIDLYGIKQADSSRIINPVTTARLIAQGKYTDDALLLAAAGFDVSRLHPLVDGYITSRSQAG